MAKPSSKNRYNSDTLVHVPPVNVVNQINLKDVVSPGDESKYLFYIKQPNVTSTNVFGVGGLTGMRFVFFFPTVKSASRSRLNEHGLTSF